MTAIVNYATPEMQPVLLTLQHLWVLCCLFIAVVRLDVKTSVRRTGMVVAVRACVSAKMAASAIMWMARVPVHLAT